MIDARGFSCPVPVVMTQREITANAPAALEVLLDNRAAVENVTRFAQSRGYDVALEAQGADFLLRLKK